MHKIEVIKRNGSIVTFNKEKIEKVLEKIDKEVKFIDKVSIRHMMDDIVRKINGNTRMSVEAIQDIVFYTLCTNGLFEQAKAFQTYRTQRAEQRLKEANGVFRHMTDIVDVGDRENSNKNSMLPSVQRDLIAGEYFRYILEKSIDKELWAAHRKKTIHWHDSDVDTKLTNCCLFNIEDMLRNGTRITNADVCQPNSVGTAMNIAMQIMASISASQYGGVSLPNFNEVFAEYAKKNFKKNFTRAYNDKLSTESNISRATEEDIEKEFGEISSGNEKLASEKSIEFQIAKERTAKDIYDACQLFEYQTNSILGSASQTPFSTITFNIPTSWESEHIILSYLKVRQTGLGEKHIPAIFPKLSYMVVDGYNFKKGDKYFYITEEVSKCIANTYYPDILFYSKGDYDAGKYYARMGCRSRVNHEYQVNGEYQHYGRFNYGVATLNVPQIALDVLKDERYGGAEGNRLERFLEILEKRKELMKKAIQTRFENVKYLQAKKAPILFQYGGIARLEPDDTIEELLKTDRASVSYGFLGLDDAVRILSDNKENISTEKGHEMGIAIMEAMRKQADDIKSEIGLPVSVYGTPAESSIATFFNKDVENYGEIMPEWLREREYYTNSFHFSSELPIDSFDKIDVEAPFIKYCNGGNIMYVENGGKTYNSQAIIELIQYAHDAGIEYFAVNTISDVCYECGYTGEISYNEKTASYKCPHCGNEDGMKMKIQRRCCGYISNYNITHALEGRMKEIKNRAIHVK